MKHLISLPGFSLLWSQPFKVLRRVKRWQRTFFQNLRRPHWHHWFHVWLDTKVMRKKFPKWTFGARLTQEGETWCLWQGLLLWLLLLFLADIILVMVLMPSTSCGPCTTLRTERMGRCSFLPTAYELGASMTHFKDGEAEGQPALGTITTPITRWGRSGSGQGRRKQPPLSWTSFSRRCLLW